MAKYEKPPMELKQALTLLADLGEWEAENPAVPNPPPGWAGQLTAAAKVTRQFLAERRPPAGPFFTAPVSVAKSRGRAGGRKFTI